MNARKPLSLLLALLILAALPSCHSSRKASVRKDSAKEPTVVVDHKIPESKRQHRLIEEAYTWLGTPYVYAMAEKGVGTDCSGMVMSLYKDVAGCAIPRNSAKQAEFCEPLTDKEIETGDLVFFATGKDPEKISHVGLLIDGNTFIHASSSKGVVISELDTPYYRRTFRGFGRVPRQLTDLP